MILQQTLKSYILTQYRSIREFAKDIDIPYTTVYGILKKKNICRASMSVVTKICATLKIDSQKLLDGEIIQSGSPHFIQLPIEEQLKDFILSKYRSILEFTKLACLPYSTVDNIFKRGMQNSNVFTLITICRTLGISIDDLVQGEIREKDLYTYNNPMMIKIGKLNTNGQIKAEDYIDDLIASGNYALAQKR
jgi:predicted transcriptional regulator